MKLKMASKNHAKHVTKIMPLYIRKLSNRIKEGAKTTKTRGSGKHERYGNMDVKMLPESMKIGFWSSSKHDGKGNRKKLRHL